MKDNLSNESALRAKMQRNLPGDSWFAWRVTAITTVIASILIPLLLYFLSRPEQEPKFIIENCILRTDAVLVIKADNKKANHRKYLNIIYDGCTFPKKGVPINSNSGDIQRWHFLLKNLTQDMKKGSHWIQVCFPGGKRSEKFNIKFVNDPPIEKVTTKTQISENKIKNSNNIYKSIWVTPFRSQNTSLGEGYAKGCASQLSKAPNINIIENDIINEEINIKDSSTISNIGQLHGADYSLIGSINIIDKNLNIDARLIDNNNSKVLLYFSKKNQGREYLELLLAYEVAKTLNSLLPLPIFEKKSNLLIKPQDKALQFFNNKKYSDAFNLYSKILYKKINNIELHRDILKTSRLGKLNKNLLVLYKDLMRIHPNNAIIRNYLGNAYLLVGQKDKALEQYMEAQKLDPNFNVPKANIAIISYLNKEWEKAQSLFEEYLKINPEDAVSWLNLGKLYASMFKKNPEKKEFFHKAKSAFNKANSIVIMEAAYEQLIILFIEAGNKEKASKILAVYKGLIPDESKIKSLENKLRKYGTISVSQCDITGNMDLRERKYATGNLYHKIDELLAMKKFEEAEFLLKRLIPLVPGNWNVYNLLGKALQGQGGKNNIYKAKKAYEEAERLKQIMKIKEKNEKRPF